MGVPPPAWSHGDSADAQADWGSSRWPPQSASEYAGAGLAPPAPQAKRPRLPGNHGYSEDMEDPDTYSNENRPACQYYNQGFCYYGNSCWYAHCDWSSSWGSSSRRPGEEHWSDDETGIRSPLSEELWVRKVPRSERAGLRIIVGGPCHSRPVAADLPTEQRATGPLRLRVVGDVQPLGCYESYWDPQYGMDLIWEGERWVSCLVDLPQNSLVTFCILRVDQPESHPGVLQGCRRIEVHESRHFEWSAEYTIRIPASGLVVDATFQDLERLWSSGKGVPPNQEPSLDVRRRQEIVAFPDGSCGLSLLRPAPIPGGQRCYTFDGPGPEGETLKFSLYLPPRFGVAQGDVDGVIGWPLLIFLHSMHARLDGDMNLFYESDTLVRLLLGAPDCPAALRERFVVISPQCPPDIDRQDGAGIWLRAGWYEDSSYDTYMEAALRGLIEAVAGSCQVDSSRISITGSSMGAYGALELASRWPGFFSAAAPVAAHYDLDPVEDLVAKLTAQQSLPLWFFHALNDEMCPYKPMAALVEQLRERSKGEVRLTSFQDTWSSQGHCSDRVAYWAKPQSPGQEAFGDELFEWLADHRSQGQHGHDQSP